MFLKNNILMSVKQRYLLKLLMAAFLVALFAGCRKSSFLDENSNKSNIVPHTVGQYQAVLDGYFYMNFTYSSLMEVGADDYYANDDYLKSSPDYARNVYIWNDDVEFMLNEAWNQFYKQIMEVNLVADELNRVEYDDKDKQIWENAKGTVMFLRAFYLFNLSQIFCPAYDKVNAGQQLGLSLRLTGDVDEKINRSSNKVTYTQMINDLELALNLLPVTPSIKTRPSKNACYALLARVYLVMQNYEQALKYADLSLDINNGLLDYNDVSSFQSYHTEVIWHAVMQSPINLPIYSFGSEVNSKLVQQYAPYDRRLALFFADNGAGGKYFTGSYENVYGLPFAGLATDEVYLVKAECEARLGNKDKALLALNTLLAKRFDRSGSWAPYTAGTAEQALQLILTERRKELLMRGLRFSDLKRLNKEGANITLERIVDGVSYVLPPNDKRYTYLIPATVIGFNPGMPQNER